MPVSPPGGRPSWWPSRQAFLDGAVDPAGLRRLAGDLVPEGSVQVLGPLPGGVESAVHAVVVTDGGRASRPAVLKRRQDGAVDGTGEWAGLAAAAGAGVATPEPMAFDPDGRWFGVPALLMSRLPGAGDLHACGDERSLRQLAAALVAIHDGDGSGLHQPPPPWLGDGPDDATPYEAAVWERIARLRPGVGAGTALVHRDFHPGNVLWAGGRLTGVVDWEDAALGWPGEDLARCRWHLALLHGPDTARRFLAAYQAESGRLLPHLALCDAAYGVGVLRQAEERAFFLRRSGVAGATADGVRATARWLIAEALGAEFDPAGHANDGPTPAATPGNGNGRRRRGRSGTAAPGHRVARPAATRAGHPAEGLPVVEQAKGILIARHRYGSEHALDTLREAAQRLGVPPPDLARLLVDLYRSDLPPDDAVPLATALLVDDARRFGRAMGGSGAVDDG